MIRTSRQLADGREILYYDDDRHPAPREAEDARDLPPVATRSQLRFDPLLGEWVVVAAHRQSRTFLPPADQCPLCPSRPGRPTEVPESDYQVAVFENRFPSLATDVDRDVPPAAAGNPLAELRPGFGRCEVVCFTSDHDRQFADLGPERARLVVDTWADRTAELSALDGVAQVFCFENHGEEIGVTLSHPHGQIYGYPFVPPRIEKVLASVRRHRAATGADLFGEVLAAERTGPRVVAANEHWTAFVPAAARWPYEVQLFPTRKVPDLPALTGAERDGFVAVYLDVLGRFASRFDTPMPYIAAWNQAPVGDGRDDWWLHLQLFSLRRAPGKLKYLAGSESGMGAFITDTNPEDVAEQLRAVVLP
ncbi:galactose-1-phosphate uridylyltransferase [Blastococcus xanthinilyticus]|uniref:Galactose-1-phosphate uridylyltransferase n=1 Tax=Blastococcus xanthinilyticus TaxID=1564164 RepID=A0A5S5CUH6_9ACTN|nr:galactose-1-phosphate uridylyltransferase [Blastococcus xanthinilyticus]TYP85979.1 UDPglucose--hexose-1-phosphate uridylyltransferase [Blastococcus xanthinilyticus]